MVPVALAIYDHHYLATVTIPPPYAGAVAVVPRAPIARVTRLGPSGRPHARHFMRPEASTMGSKKIFLKDVWERETRAQGFEPARAPAPAKHHWSGVRL